jgi:glycine/D-amino acid oxidase-like deaminating enzyme
MQLDLLVIGGGIAGCCVAWQAKRRGLDVGLVDRCHQDTASRVAAGLVTPITGSRLALTWRWPEYFPIAASFYRWLEAHTGERFWHEQPAWRIFGSCEERQRFETRWATSDGLAEQARSGLQLELLSSQSIRSLHAPWGGMSMSPAARLGTECFLSSTVIAFQACDRYWPADLDMEHDFRWEQGSVSIDALQLRCNQVFDCRGFDALGSGWFQSLPLHPARGDILELTASTSPLSAVVHADAWAVPLEESRVLVGATYDRHALHSDIPSAAAEEARRVLLERWDRMTASSESRPLAASKGEAILEQDALGIHLRTNECRVLQQRAAVRPASYDRHPLIGIHPDQTNIACLNGLGSKGSLMGPGLADKLLALVYDGTALEPELDWGRRQRMDRKPG